MIDIIDVTLRDGGHAVKFDWPIKLAQDYYNLMSDTKCVKFAELGYWGQTAKSKNKFYNLNMDSVLEITRGQGLGNVSIMIDYHYCSHDLKNYPTANQNEIGMIRMCSRKEDIDDALVFGAKLKKYTGINVSFNIFNSTNYSKEELVSIAKKMKPFSFDFVYFADTHGSLDLRDDYVTFEEAIQILKDSGKGVGLHLHDHSGKGYLNYSLLDKLGIQSTDSSVRGMGKGSGNLRLEYLVDKSDLTDIAQFIYDNESILTMKPVPHELITAKYSLTDNYARQAYEMKMRLKEFDDKCSKITGLDKDTYDSTILESE